jgi:hypothetical protein
MTGRGPAVTDVRDVAAVVASVTNGFVASFAHVLTSKNIDESDVRTNHK